MILENALGQSAVQRAMRVPQRTTRALARYQELDYCTTFSGNNAPQTPQKIVTRINIKHGNDRMGVVNQMSSVICQNRWCSYNERRYRHLRVVLAKIVGARGANLIT